MEPLPDAVLWITLIVLSVIAAIVITVLVARAATVRPTREQRERDQVLAQLRAMRGEPAAEGEPTWDAAKRTISTGESGAGLL